MENSCQNICRGTNQYCYNVKSSENMDCYSVPKYLNITLNILSEYFKYPIVRCYDCVMCRFYAPRRGAKDLQKKPVEKVRRI